MPKWFAHSGNDICSGDDCKDIECVQEIERERESVCVCARHCEREREREREREKVSECGRIWTKTRKKLTIRAFLQLDIILSDELNSCGNALFEKRPTNDKKMFSNEIHFIIWFSSRFGENLK